MFNISCDFSISSIEFHSSEKQDYRDVANIANPHHAKANEMAGYQLLDSVIIGHDNTWFVSCEETSIDYLSHNKEIKIDIGRNKSTIFVQVNNLYKEIFSLDF